ncbi:hypothetical protein KIS4809_0810 [Bacillus sp. ZZV12-4809]|nr:hypothetical protein KIS4809_0810 [Bacillus sp. ZZV12-4809]
MFTFQYLSAFIIVTLMAEFLNLNGPIKQPFLFTFFIHFHMVL